MTITVGEKRQLAVQLHEELGLQTPLAVVFLEYLFAQAELFDKKQQDYGSANIAKFGDVGIMVKVSDKVERIVNLWKTGKQPVTESKDNDWLDIGNYAPMTLMCRNGDWPGVEAEQAEAPVGCIRCGDSYSMHGSNDCDGFTKRVT